MSEALISALLPILAVMLAGLFCIVRFFRETTSQRMVRLTGDAKNRQVSISTGDDPHGLGRMMECTGRDIGPMLAAGRSGSDSNSGSGGCGDGGSGE
jgi:hypothetical protein